MKSIKDESGTERRMERRAEGTPSEQRKPNQGTNAGYHPNNFFHKTAIN